MKWAGRIAAGVVVVVIVRLRAFTGLSKGVMGPFSGSLEQLAPAFRELRARCCKGHSK